MGVGVGVEAPALVVLIVGREEGEGMIGWAAQFGGELATLVGLGLSWPGLTGPGES